MRKLMIGLLALTAFGAGCGGGGTPAPQDQAGTTEFKAAVDSARVARLATAPASALAVVSGQLTLQGFTIQTEAGTPVAGTGFGSVFARIIDPGDDILSIVTGQPDATGKFSLTLPSVPARAILEVNFKVAADLDGDGTGGDTVRQRVPLRLAAGKVVTADISLRQQAGFQPGTPVSGTPPTVVAASIDVLDADGRHSFNRASDYAGGEIVADANGDGKFDPLAELVLADTNADGLDDASYSRYTESAPYATVYGVVTRVDQYKRTAELLVKQGDSGYLLNVSIDPQAAVELYLPKAPGGQSFAQLNPDQFLLGRSVYVDGFYTDGAVQRALAAQVVTVLQ